MRHDLADGAFAPDELFDVCIVGAGAAGTVLALELSRAGRRVILMESGGPTLEEPSQKLYDTDVIGQPHTGVHKGRFRAWGGTTIRWGGQILELEPIDFAHRDWVAHSGWPITKDDLFPFYATAFEFEGLIASLHHDEEVWRAVGEELPDLGSELEPYFTRWCPQPNFARLHGAEMAASSRVSSVVHANLMDVVLEDDGVHVRKAVFRSLNGNQATVRAREFVLAIGAIETSRLLLHLQESHDERWNPNGLVGTGFQDHVDCDVVNVRPLDRERFLGSFTNVLLGGYKYHPKFRLSSLAQSEYRVLNVAGTFAFRDSSDEIAGAIKSTGRRLLRGAWGEMDGAQVVHLLANFPMLLRQAWSYKVNHRVYNSPDAALSLRVHCEQEPDGASRVTLADERDALGMRRARLDWRISLTELDTIRTFLDVAGRNLKEQKIAELVPTIDLRDDAALRERCDDGLHHIGGTRMSAIPTDGVVDVDLRLHGIPNLSLCSASVFPTGGYSNPTHTVLALAVRLARRLARQTAAV
ncbi:GMC oxidoreductase [Terriglobus roseus]|uniref:Choline dehydrogenase n=1 Tax=Terriglobus roseus TaxID=392734 RepID=A0A1H4JKC3_9BACT|nr:GMC family oxidoreductase [Terriglobus roseus]SEB46771.1 Choline dehydrogenase [Terriglobus roseus]